MGIKRVEIEGGDWVDLKEKLKIGDKANIQGQASDGIASDQKSFRFNVVRYNIANAAVRIVNWSLKDDDGKPIDYPTGKPFNDRVRAVSGLDEEVFDKINTAIEAFEDTLSKEKNGQMAGANA